MKKFTKAFVMILTIILLGVCIIMPVNAYSATASLTTSSTLTAGGAVTVILNLSNLDAGDGVDGLTATLEYDESVLETSESQFVGDNEWRVIGYNSDTKNFSVLRNSLFTTSGSILKITFKVKENISVTSTKVSLKNIELAGESEGVTSDIPVGSATVTISAPIPEPEPTPTPEPTTPTNTIIKDNTTTQKTTLPKTGVSQTIIIVIAVVAIIAILSYIIYKKIAKEVK